MKTYLVLFIAVVGLAACNKVELSSPSFSIATDKSTYHVGDTVFFSFTGNPDNVVFYSGEPGFRYANRMRTNADGGQTTLTFSSAVSGGSQTNNLALMASTNFSGAFDAASIAAATWTNITSRAALATSATALSSGPVSLTDLAVAGKPVYLAFKYTSPTNVTGSIGRSWTITPFTVNTTFPDGSKNAAAADIATGGFAPVSITGDSLKWIVQAASLKFNTGYIGNGDEDWAISRAFDLTAVPPDAGIPVKNMSTVLSSIPYYIYTKPGTYTISFAVSNGNIDEIKSDVKELTITVTP